jgi:hypothetical protein
MYIVCILPEISGVPYRTRGYDSRAWGSTCTRVDMFQVRWCLLNTEAAAD